MKRALVASLLALLGIQAHAPGLPAPRLPRLPHPFRAVASWYGGHFHGRKTSSGERFDKRGRTAAHRTLPFGTRLLLRWEGRAVLVRITDRGPWLKGRDLDISEAAAEALGMRRAGVVQLEAQVIPCS